MNGKDLFCGLGYVNEQFIHEAESVVELRSGGSRRFPRAVTIAAVIGLLALTITACAYAVSRIRMNLVQHNVPVQTEASAAGTASKTGSILTCCYPQMIPEGYEILCGSPVNHTRRSIQYQNPQGGSITFGISTTPGKEDIALKPPVEEKTVALSCGEAVLKSNDGAQVLSWHDPAQGYYATLFTDDVQVDLLPMADSVAYGPEIPVSVWYHRGAEWDPWYPQRLPDGYTCTDVAPITRGYQLFTYENGAGGYIRYGISTVENLMPDAISDTSWWEEVQMNGSAGKMLCNQSNQRTLFWENREEGFWAFLETTDKAVALPELAQSVGPGPKLEVSKFWLGPDYTIELEQEPTTYIQWQSIYPQSIPEGYVLDFVSDRAYGRQTMEWNNADGGTILYTLYYRLGEYGMALEGSGQPKTVDINGHTGYRTGNSLVWTDEELGFAYELKATEDVDLIALAKSVAPGEELEATNDGTAAALAQLGDYRITALSRNMMEDSLTGSPLEDGGGWYSYVRRWYYDKTNNAQVFFSYETYLSEWERTEDTLKLWVPLSETGETEFITINDCPGMTHQDGGKARVSWLVGDAAKGVHFELYSEQFTVAELLEMARSVREA